MTWWLKDSERYDAIICDGAVRSGKTYSMGVSFFCWAMHQFNNQQFGLCGKTIGALRRNLLHQVLPTLQTLGFHIQENRSNHTLIVRLGRRENQFILFGGHDESSAALIQGITLAGVLLDETALMPRSFVEQACARCSVNGSKLWFNCNPENPFHWFYQEWILKAEERKALYLHFTMDDNPGLSPKIRERYRKTYTGVFYRRFILGEWTAAEGRIYDFFHPESDCQPVPEGTMERWRVSVDYGTVNPASFGLWGLQNGVWYRVSEYYYDSHREGKQKTDAEYLSDLKQLIGTRTVEQIVVDPSAASFITTLKKAGFPVRKANNDVLNGIRVTADKLMNRNIVICDTCPDCLRELSLYVWDPASGREAPKKENDHAMDDMRYFAMSLQNEKRFFAATWVERRADRST